MVQRVEQQGSVALAEAAEGSCEKCRNEPGRPYSFLYGMEMVRTENRGGYRESTRTEQLDGEETAMLGDRCIAEHHRRAFRRMTITLAVSAVMMVAGLALLAPTFFGGLDAEVQPLQLVGFFVACIAAIAFLASIAGVWVERSLPPLEQGEQLAIEVRKNDLERRGFNASWTHRTWDSKVHLARS